MGNASLVPLSPLAPLQASRGVHWLKHETDEQPALFWLGFGSVLARFWLGFGSSVAELEKNWVFQLLGLSTGHSFDPQLKLFQRTKPSMAGQPSVLGTQMDVALVPAQKEVKTTPAPNGPSILIFGAPTIFGGCFTDAKFAVGLFCLVGSHESSSMSPLSTFFFAECGRCGNIKRTEASKPDVFWILWVPHGATQINHFKRMISGKPAGVLGMWQQKYEKWWHWEQSRWNSVATARKLH